MPVPDHQQKLRERKNLQHAHSIAMEKTRTADLVNELRADPERMMDLIRFTNLWNNRVVSHAQVQHIHQPRVAICVGFLHWRHNPPPP
jgi:hypothetical protein